MTDMVERVARAIAKAEHIRFIGKVSDRDIAILWPQRTSEARAAIEAAFQVTDEDAKAFFGDEDGDTNWLVNGDFGPEFGGAMQALSDAALKEGS